jgi:AhpD family alkylhydroperoxidase
VGIIAACVHHPILGERVPLDLCGWAVSNGTETLIVLRGFRARRWWSPPVQRNLIPASEEGTMIPESRADVDRDIEATLGLVPEFFKQVPDYLIPTEWASFKSLELSDQTAIPNKYKELIGLAVSGATRCRYCCYFHTEAARLFGASEDEITETALIAKNTMGWSTYLNTLQFDYDEFTTEFDQIATHVREQMAAGASA